MSMTLKTTKNMCFGLSVVFKITTRRSTIDVRKKSDLSRKNRTTGPPGHVRKISDQPQPDDRLAIGHVTADHACFNTKITSATQRSRIVASYNVHSVTFAVC